ncbi:hypothetical protein YTPLAS73_12600 [Nitrosarchaeum sp.]|nr:hypothetical protein YTPLAS73_12600 [Nitrosarchaeum sp.]
MKEKERRKAIELIKCCMIYRYSTEESLQHLESHKIKIAERTLRRYKEQIKNEEGQSTVEIAQQEMEEGLNHNIETTKQIQHECWKHYQVAHPTNRIKILSLIQKSTLNLDKFYKSIPSLEKMKKETGYLMEKLDKIKTDAHDSIVNQIIQKIS